MTVRKDADVQQFFFVLNERDLPRLCCHGIDYGRWERDDDQFKVRVSMETHTLKPGESCGYGYQPAKEVGSVFQSREPRDSEATRG